MAAIITSTANGTPDRPKPQCAAISTMAGITSSLSSDTCSALRSPPRTPWVARLTPISTRHTGTTALPSPASVWSSTGCRPMPVRFQAMPSSTGSTTGWMMELRTVLRSAAARVVAVCVRARSDSTSTVSSVSNTMPCTLTSATCSARPVSPKRAEASGMPSCTALPYTAATVRVAGAAGWAGAPRLNNP